MASDGMAGRLVRSLAVDFFFNYVLIENYALSTITTGPLNVDETMTDEEVQQL